MCNRTDAVPQKTVVVLEVQFNCCADFAVAYYDVRPRVDDDDVRNKRIAVSIVVSIWGIFIFIHPAFLQLLRRDLRNVVQYSKSLFFVSRRNQTKDSLAHQKADPFCRQIQIPFPLSLVLTHLLLE